MMIKIIIAKLIEVILIRQEFILLCLLFGHLLLTALLLRGRLLSDLNFTLLGTPLIFIFLRIFF
jgi:hypothetical protein